MSKLVRICCISIVCVLCTVFVLSSCDSNVNVPSVDKKDEMVRMFADRTDLSEETIKYAIDAYCEHEECAIRDIDKVGKEEAISYEDTVVLVDCISYDDKEYTFAFDSFGSSYYLSSIYCKTTDQYIYAIIE